MTPTQQRAIDWRTPAMLGLVVVAFIVSSLWDQQQTSAVTASTIRQAMPFILGGLCGLIGERSGIINIGIEGQMLLSAFVGFMVASWTGNLWIAAVAAMAAASLAGLFLAWTAVALKMDQIIAGTVINIFAVGFTTFAYQQGRTMPSVPNVAIPGLSELPRIGSVLFDHGPLVYGALIATFVVHIAIFSTRWGLRTRAIGEHPSAADTVGVNVYRLRYLNLALAGTLAGLAGMSLLQTASTFERNMSNGKGFIALAVMIIGRYRPFGVLAAALLFGFFNALQSQLQLNQAADIPPQFFGMIPFAMTIAVLAVAGVRARPPAAIGQPYEKG
jgi:simple sugar transport system permease protein